MVTDENYNGCGGHFIMYINVELLCCTPEGSIILYASYTPIEKIPALKHWI